MSMSFHFDAGFSLSGIFSKKSTTTAATILPAPISSEIAKTRRPGIYFSLNLLRVVATYGVLIKHFMAHLHGPLGLSLERINRIHFVDLFFVLSGLLLMQIYGPKMRNFGGYFRFLQQRLARLYPLHAATAIGLVAIGLVLAVAGVHVRMPQTFDLGQLPQHLLMIQSWNTIADPGLNGPSWSMSAEFLLALIFPALVLIVERGGALLALCLAVASAAAFQWFRQTHGLAPWWDATYDFGAIRALPLFMSGMVVSRLLRDNPGWSLPWTPTLILAGGLAIGVILEANHELTLVALPLLLLALILSERRYSPSFLAHRSIAILSDLTFSLCLIHTFSGNLLIVAVRNLGMVSTPAIVAMMAAFTVMTTWCAWLVHRYFEGPTRKLLSREFRLPSVPAMNALAVPFRRAILTLAVPAATLSEIVATIGKRLF